MQDVNALLKQYAQMRKMFKGMGQGGGKMQRRLMSQMGQMGGGTNRFGR